MRESSYYYKYITIYIDDLLIATKDPEGIINFFLIKHRFKLKETSSIKYHLGCDFYYNKDIILYFHLRNSLRR